MSGRDPESVFEATARIPKVDQEVYHLARLCMSETLGVDKEQTRLITIESDSGIINSVIVDASPNGQHIGRYADIMAHRAERPDYYLLSILGVSVDPLAATTEKVYRAMIHALQQEGRTTMPDSVELSHINNVPWTATMLTGEELTEDGLIPIASYSSDKVDVVGFNPNRGGISMRVRPAVNITSLEHEIAK